MPTYQQTRYDRLKSAGLCVKCGQPATPGSIHCQPCRLYMRDKSRERQRRVHGWRPWQAGSRGRPPVSE